MSDEENDETSISHNRTKMTSDRLIEILERILNGDKSLFNTSYDCSMVDTDNIEYQIIIDVMNEEDFTKKWEKWCNNPNTNCKLLNFIIHHEIDVIIPDHNIFLSKDFADITFKIFDFIDDHIQDFDKFISLYGLIKNKHNDIHWKFLEQRDFDRYMKFSQIYSFDPFNGINKRKTPRRKFSIDDKDDEFFNYCSEIFNDDRFSNCSIDETIKLINEIKNHIRSFISNKSGYFLAVLRSFIARGMINEVIDMFENEIDQIINIESRFFEDIAHHNNIKLIDYVLQKYEQFIDEIHYNIIVYSSKETITIYFPDLTQNKLDELVIKWKKNEWKIRY